jgi:Holliday junction resolvasome RuvABC endonuclease subunit
MKKYYIGIDPGLTGALVCLDGAGYIRRMTVMPTVKIGKGNKLDAKAISSWIKKCFTEEMVRMVAIEEQRAMHKQGVTSTFTTGRGYGIIEGIVSALELPYEIVRPIDWQKVMFRGSPKGKGKALSKSIAQQLFPNETFKKSDRCKNLHDGLTDAVLIAEYIRRKIK